MYTIYLIKAYDYFVFDVDIKRHKKNIVTVFRFPNTE